jgi:hypothetical protein
MTKHNVSLEKNAGCGYAKVRVMVKEYNNAGFGVGAVKEGESARKVCGGTLHPGPWAYAYALAAVIDNNGGTMRDIEKQRAEGSLIEAAFDDVLIIEGHEYVIKPDHNRNIQLVAV